MFQENIHKVDDFVRQTSVHLSNSLYHQSKMNRKIYLETDFNYGSEDKTKLTNLVNGVQEPPKHVRQSKSLNDGFRTSGAAIEPNFITSNDDTSVVTNPTDPTLVAPLAQEESLTNGFHSLASTETDPLFKIKPEEATKYVKEHSVVRSNIIDVVKQPPEPPNPKIQLSLKYNLTNMTLSVVVHKIRNLQETSVTWIPSAKVVTRVIEMNGISRFRRVVNTKRKTKTQRHNVSPVFEETLEYFLPVGDVKRRRLEVSVYHDSRFPGRFIGRNVVLGRCLVRKF